MTSRAVRERAAASRRHARTVDELLVSLVLLEANLPTLDRLRLPVRLEAIAGALRRRAAARD